MELIKPTAEIIELNPSPLKHIEKIARTCYKSEDKITDDSAPKFVKMLYARGHYAMLEFYYFYFNMETNLAMQLAYLNQLPEINGDFMFYDRNIESVSASCNLRTAIMFCKYNAVLALAIIKKYPELEFLFSGITCAKAYIVNNIELELQYETVKFIIDRGVSHELVRHRKCSFAQESTRYCNYGKQEHVKFIIPSWITDVDKEISEDRGTAAWYDAIQNAENDYFYLVNNDEHNKWTPQQARSVLPNSLKTEIIVQARLSEWKHIFKLRCDKAAHPDMRAVMIPLQEKFKEKYPNYF